MKTRKASGEQHTDVLERSKFYRLLPVPALVVLVLLFFLPLVSTLSRAFISSDGTVTTAAFSRLFTEPYTLRLLGTSVLQAAVSTLVSFIIGMPGAYILAHYNFPGKKIVRAIATIPFVLPSILVVLGFVIFYGNNGLLNRFLMMLTGASEPPLPILYSFSAIIMAHAFFNFPIFMNIVSSYWESMDSRLEDAALTLGASPATVFRSVTLPRLLPSMISSAILVFLFCFSSFAVILVLGGGPRFSTLEVEIYRASRSLETTSYAAALSFLSMTVMVLLLLLYSAAQKKSSRHESHGNGGRARILQAGKSARIAMAIYTLLTSIFVLAPLLGIVYRSLRSPISRAGGEEFSFRWYRELFRMASSNGHMATGWNAIMTSMAIAVVVALVTVPLAVGIASALRKKKAGALSLELVAMLPMAVSSVMIGLGYFLIKSRLNTPGAAYILVVLAHMVIALPFVLRAILPEYRRIPPTIQHAALTMGASPVRVFWSVELPILRRALITGGIFAFALSMGEITATLTLSDSVFTTIPLVMYRLIGSYNYQGACALGTLLIIVCTIVFFISEASKKRRKAYDYE